ncbi:uncharacterized protein EAF02_010461 [Botrytis sinoallii]|uniref:uncharacterized protein n=1 Tax=Botrytis sinoallii TaxID=1463999 RepID=UPI001900C258|nr:uncharacterized protein EAF02_010461 [Botrytis sinoallii]KAF7862912.1 hypothetical protein EAF02_010461 [Botrytis sinoallii]
MLIGILVMISFRAVTTPKTPGFFLFHYNQLNTDQSAVLEAAQLLGYVSVGMLMLNLRWPRARAKTAIEDLVSESMLWVDKQSEEWEYWKPWI